MRLSRLFVALVGVLVGHFAAFPVLVVVSALSLLVAIYLKVTMKEMAVLFLMIYAYMAALGNLAMWVAWYVSTEQTWAQEFFRAFLR